MTAVHVKNSCLAAASSARDEPRFVPAVDSLGSSIRNIAARFVLQAADRTGASWDEKYGETPPPLHGLIGKLEGNTQVGRWEDNTEPGLEETRCKLGWSVSGPICVFSKGGKLLG